MPSFGWPLTFGAEAGDDASAHRPAEGRVRRRSVRRSRRALHGRQSPAWQPRGRDGRPVATVAGWATWWASSAQPPRRSPSAAPGRAMAPVHAGGSWLGACARREWSAAARPGRWRSGRLVGLGDLHARLAVEPCDRNQGLAGRDDVDAAGRGGVRRRGVGRIGALAPATRVAGRARRRLVGGMPPPPLATPVDETFGRDGSAPAAAGCRRVRSGPTR